MGRALQFIILLVLHVYHKASSIIDVNHMDIQMQADVIRPLRSVKWCDFENLESTQVAAGTAVFGFATLVGLAVPRN